MGKQKLFLFSSTRKNKTGYIFRVKGKDGRGEGGLGDKTKALLPGSGSGQTFEYRLRVL